MTQEIGKLFGADEAAVAPSTDKVEAEALLVQPREHREATVLAFTTFVIGNMPVNITIREGWTESEIDSIFDGMDYINKLVDLRNGLVVTSNQYSTIETDGDGYVTGMRKIQTVYDNGPKQAQPSEPVNSPFAPGDDAPVENSAQAPQQRTQQAPQQAQDKIAFVVDRVEWASMAPSKSKPGQFTTTFRVYDDKGHYSMYGVPCYPEALQKAGFDIGGATGGWVLNLAGQGWVAYCFPSENLNKYGGYSPKKVAYFAKGQPEGTTQQNPF